MLNTFKKITLVAVLFITIGIAAYICFCYYYTFSTGYRSGELIKISEKGVLFKTWEGEMSQGMSGSQIFKFSIMDNQPKIIEKMKEYQGRYVKVEYAQKVKTFPWWGDTVYFITNIQPEQSPYFNTK
jgi:hypothetical protein